MSCRYLRRRIRETQHTGTEEFSSEHEEMRHLFAKNEKGLLRNPYRMRKKGIEDMEKTVEEEGMMY